MPFGRIKHYRAISSRYDIARKGIMPACYRWRSCSCGYRCIVEREMHGKDKHTCSDNVFKWLGNTLDSGTDSG